MSRQSILATLKRSIFAFLSVIFLAISVMTVFGPAPVSAAGDERYTWGSFINAYTLSAGSGAFGSGASFSAPRPAVPTSTLTLKLAMTYSIIIGDIACQVVPSSSNTLTITVQTANPTVGVINFPADTGNYTGGIGSCEGNARNWAAIHNYFNNVQITIGGTPPTGVSPESQKQINVTALPGQDPSLLPPTARFSIKAGKNHTLAESIALPSLQTATGPYRSPIGYGPVIFTLEPGDYSVCAEWDVGRACNGITKGAGPMVIQLKDLQSKISSRVEIRMCFNGDAATEYPIGPYEITLQDAKNTKLIASETDSRTVRSNAGAGNADSRVCIPAFIDDINSGTGLVGYLESQDGKISHDVNLAPGNFKICVTVLNKCQPYGPSVVFILNDIEGDQMMSATQKDKDPPTACQLSFGERRTSSVWVCPITEIVNFGVGKFDDLINANLQPDLTIFDQTGNGSSYHAAWNSMRVIALGIVVIALLIAVIAQAAGIEVIDAYAMRKLLLPGALAAVAIGASWDILEVFFRLSDAGTTGLRSLIYAPFSGLDPIQLGGGSAFSSFLLGGGALVAMGWMALLSFGLSALIAVGLAFFILVLIKVALSAVLITAPIFIAASILPGTRKVYEFGKGALISLLLAPLVVGGMIAFFRVGAVIAYNRQDGNAAINQIIAILLYFGAYFAILKGLSAMGGVAATITGAVSDRGRGMMDGLKKYRGNKRKERMELMKTGDLYKGSAMFGAGGVFNAASQRVSNVGQAGFGILPGSRRKHKAARDLNARAAQARSEKDELMQQGQYDDDGMAALYLSGGKSARRARKELRRLNPDWSDERINNAVATAETIGINRRNSMAAGVLAAKNKFRSMGSGQALIDAIESTSAYAAGGDEQLRNNYEQGVKYWARVSGRTDAAGGNMDESWNKTDMGELSRSSPAAMKAHLNNVSHRIRTGRETEIRAQWTDASGNWLNDADGNAYSDARLQSEVGRQKHLAAVQMVELHSILAHGTNADNQAAINQEFDALGYGSQERAAVSVEDYAAWMAGMGNPGSGAGQAVRSEARGWDPSMFPELRERIVSTPSPVPIVMGGAARMGIGGPRPTPSGGGGSGGGGPAPGGGGGSSGGGGPTPGGPSGGGEPRPTPQPTSTPLPSPRPSPSSKPAPKPPAGTPAMPPIARGGAKRMGLGGKAPSTPPKPSSPTPPPSSSSKPAPTPKTETRPTPSSRPPKPPIAPPIPKKTFESLDNKDLATTKYIARESLAAQLSALPEIPSEVGAVEKLGYRDNNPAINSAVDNMVNSVVETRARNGEATYVRPHESGMISPNKLSAEDVRTVVDSLPKGKENILPVYASMVQVQRQLDRTSDPTAKQALADRASALSDIATTLMTDGAPGWDDVRVETLRKSLAMEHPHLRLPGERG